MWLCYWLKGSLLMNDADNLEQDAVNHGRDARLRLKQDQTFEDWLLVGQALEIGRQLAMRRAYTNQPVGRAYNTAFSDWMATNGFGDIDKGTRSRLADIMAHRPEIETWRQKLPQSERLRKNHPNSIWRGWTLDKRKDGQPVEDAQKTTPKPRKGAAGAIEDAVDRLHAQVDNIEDLTGSARALVFDMSEERIAESVTNFIEIYGKEDATGFWNYLGVALGLAKWTELPAALKQKPANPTNPKRTVVPDDEREARNDAIWKARKAGVSFKQLADQFGLKTAQVHRICSARYRASQTAA
jgi:hypothetical protein